MSEAGKRRADEEEEHDFGEEDAAEVEEEAPAKKKPKAKKTPVAKKVKEETAFAIGGKRKVVVSEYKGNMLVNIREFYEDRNTGQEKPSSKGIALTVDQWKVLTGQIEAINAAIEQQST